VRAHTRWLTRCNLPPRLLSVPLAIHCSLVLAVAALILAILAYTRTGQDKKEK
jgi:hypothetical protein